MPVGVRLDLGATAKALAADRAVAVAAANVDDGVLVSLGGDISVAGTAPETGWVVHVTDDHRAPVSAVGQTIAIRSGGLATSSTTVRAWERGGVPVHHIVDPASGAPAQIVWRTVSVAAATLPRGERGNDRGDRARPGRGRSGSPAERCRPASYAPAGDVVRVAGWPDPASRARTA